MIRWDLKTAIAASFRAAHPDFVPFGQFVEECTESIRPFDEPETQWPVYGVNNQTGVFFSHHQAGSEFNASYKRIRKDWFFHNPTRANVGSIGRVAKVEGNAITSPEYQIWRIKHPNWLPEFVEILIKMPFFKLMVHAHRVGAVKERLYAQNLMEIPVPHCSLETQRTIVDRWQAAASKATLVKAKAEILEADSLSEFLKSIGKEITIATKPRKMFCLNWAALERWSFDFSSRAAFGTDGYEWCFPCRPLKELCSGISGGTPLKTSEKYWGGEIPWISPKDMKKMYLYSAEDYITELATKETSAPLVNAGSVLVVMRSGILQHTVPVAITKVTASINQDLRAFTPKGDSIDPEFLGLFLRANQKKLLTIVKSSTTVQSINKDELEDLLIPTPPLETQKILVQNFKAAQSIAATHRNQAYQLREAAKREIEAALLGQVLPEAEVAGSND